MSPCGAGVCEGEKMQTSLLNTHTESKTYIDQVRERISFYGIKEASIRDLLAVIIGQNDPTTCNDLARVPIRELLAMTQDDFQQFDGIGRRKAEILESCIALANKITNEKLPPMQQIKSPDDAYRVFQDLRHNQQEHFSVAFLDTKNQITGKETVFVGSLNCSVVHPREVFNSAIKRNAASIIVAHSHPSGDPNPSTEDIHVTKRLHKAGDIVGIQLLDHIIVGDGKYISLKEKGYIK